jgi:hypothetical protein
MLLGRILSLVGIGLVLLTVPSLAEESLKPKRLQQAKEIVGQYFKLEGARDYEQAYELFSSTFRRTLSQEDSVRSSHEYKKFRNIQGLRWAKSKIRDISFDSQLNAIATVTAEYEQRVYGEHVVTGTVELIAVVVWENDKPSIDSITLSRVQ